MQSSITATMDSAPTHNLHSSGEEGAVLPPGPSSSTNDARPIESEDVLALEGFSPLKDNSVFQS